MKLFGKNPVIERLKANPKSIRQILVEEGHEDLGYIRKKGHQFGVAVSTVPASKMQKLSQGHNHQGLIADIEEFPYMDINDLLASALEKQWSLVFIDSLTDPQNLGGIMRSLGSLGGFAIVLPTHDSVSVTETVLRVASGGDNYVPVARVSNLAQAMAKAKDAGFWIMGSVVEEGQDINEVVIPFPAALVIGSEQKGIRDVILKKVDIPVTIPMAQQRMSLNAAHAAAIFAYEIMRQKKSQSKFSRNS